MLLIRLPLKRLCKLGWFDVSLPTIYRLLFKHNVEWHIKRYSISDLNTFEQQCWLGIRYDWMKESRIIEFLFVEIIMAYHFDDALVASNKGWQFMESFYKKSLLEFFWSFCTNNKSTISHLQRTKYNYRMKQSNH